MPEKQHRVNATTPLGRKVRLPWDRLPKGVALRVIRSYLAALACPRSLAVWLLYSSGTQQDHQQILELPPALPGPFEDISDFAARYAATKLFSKSAGLNVDIDRKQVALNSAAEAELRCAQTNRTTEQYMRGGSPFPGLKEDTLSVIRTKIMSVLGPVPQLETLLEIDRGWSPGRTTSVFGQAKHPVHKYNGRLDVTPSCVSLAKRFVNASPAWGAAALYADGPCSVLHAAFEYVQGNVMTVVPKSAKTDRVICYEPHVSIRLQLAVGTLLKRRMARKGINLYNQSVNQRRAKLASKTGHLATLDLKSASDTLASRVVELLLPPDWVDLLDSLRSKQTMWPDGVLRKNHKFSSMGNGFTFELESLIFWAAASAVTPGVSVFGDDIIVPTERYQDVVDVLDALGFWINPQKSFSVGYFRESCGMDAYRGARVTPVYMRDSLRTVADLVHFHNAVRQWFVDRGAPIKGARLLAKWRDQVPFLCGPASSRGCRFGDDYYHVEQDEAQPRSASSTRRFAGWEGWVVEGFTKVYLDYHWDPETVPQEFQYAALAASLGPDALRELDQTNLTGRHRYKRYRTVVPTWDAVIWV